MLNNQEFAKRLKKVIEFYDESASSFAEKIGVQRSSISHILSGRNKPSLDFVLKVLSTFPEVELYWLLNGKGTFPKTDTIQVANSSTPSLFTQPKEPPVVSPQKPKLDNKEKHIERIVIFYSDGSFENYENNSPNS
ncbi:helix-turn-helix transcriptional regulator [Flavobacteriaceae bacterium MHTCC 0001]